MRGSLVIGQLAFALLALGCGGDDDATTTPPTASGVFPTQGFTGRTMRVEVSGDATNFVAGATLDFGTGVTVSNVTVASPTALFADIAIDSAAAIGTHDVTVMNGGETYTLSKSFEFVSPVRIVTSGTFAQGSIASIELVNLDFENPFDTTCAAQSIFGCSQYANIDISAGTGVTFNVSSVDDDHIVATALIDIDATSGNVVLSSGAGATVIKSQPADAAMITARTAVAATATAANVTVTPGGTALYSFSSAASTIGQLLFDTGDTQSGGTVYILASSGHWADLVTTGAVNGSGVVEADVVAKAAGSYIAIYVDDGAGDAITAASKSLAFATTVTDTEPNNTPATAQVVTLPALFDSATLASISDLDWIKFTAAAQDAGKTIRVITTGDDPLTDSVVDAYAANGTTSLGESSDSGYGENFTSDAIAAGVNYVKISASSYFSTSHKSYIAAIWLE